MRRRLDRPSRAGSVSTSALIALPIMLLVLVGVVSLVMLRGSKTELQTSGDAAALAAGRTLADDAFLAGDPEGIRRVLARARDAAVEYATANPVNGQRIDLDRNPQHRPDGDIVFGQLDQPLNGNFVRLDPTDPDALRRVNAVRISARRSASGDPLSIRATAFLDFAVVGLKPQFGKPLPAVPVALYSCRSADGPSPERAWEHQPRIDEFRYDAESQRWVPGADGVPEVKVVLGPPGEGEQSVHGMALRIGTHNLSGFFTQVVEGVAPADLAAPEFGGELALDVRRTLAVPTAAFAEVQTDGEPFARMARAFRSLASDPTPRIWPMFSDLRDDQDERVILSGFAAVRIVKVEEEEGRVRLTLQPTIFPTPTVVTDVGRPPPPGSWGATACRLRLAE
jgi:hypothetical protein